MKQIKISHALTGLLSLALFFFGAVVFSPPSRAAATFDTLADIPVQHSGRIKPFETFAREVMLYVTGKRRWEGAGATEFVWRWIAEPEKWNREPLIRVETPELQKELDLMVINHRVSPEILLSHQPFLEKVEPALMKRQAKETLTPVEKKRLEMYEKALTFQQVGQGELPGWLAHPEKTSATWLSFKQMVSEEGQPILHAFFPPQEMAGIRESLNALFAALRTGPQGESGQTAALHFAKALQEAFVSRGIVLHEPVLKMERIYNHLQPFSWAWKIYLAAAFLFIAALIAGGLGKNAVWASWPATGLFAAGFVLHSYGFYLRCMIAGRPPVSNMYESVVWVSWGIVLFALVLSFFYRAGILRLCAALVATFALAVAQSFPALLDPFISPLVPVLRSNLWLTVHVLTITLSYGAFALAWGLGHAAVLCFAWAPSRQQTAEMLTLFLYRATQIGVVLLAAGTVLGGVWANYSWGRFWGWDPKETWALIALLGYLVVLHGRFGGWLGPFGFSMGVAIAFLGVVMAWYGVNYVLAAGLHSYGFGGGGVQYVLAVVAADLLLLGSAAWRYKRHAGSPRNFAAKT